MIVRLHRYHKNADLPCRVRGVRCSGGDWNLSTCAPKPRQGAEKRYHLFSSANLELDYEERQIVA